jgi:CRP/FNR family transcriptional regulator, cyclic AMP receptor protein
VTGVSSVPFGRTIRVVVDRELLAGSALFAGLSAEELEAVVSGASRRELRRGDVLFSEGDDSGQLFLVESGRIAMSQRSVDGRESVIALMERGDLFGEMPLFDGLGRSTEARALEPSVVTVVEYEPVHRIYEDRPALLWSVVAMLSQRLRATDSALADSVFLDVTGRTAKRLLELAGDQDEFTLPVTQEELAGMVGASRERVNKAIASFLRLGWLDQRDRRYRIVDREQLTRRAT